MGLDRLALGGVTAAQGSLLAQNGSTLIRVDEAIVARVEGITPALLNEQNPNQFVFM